jgi:hypothetical protein
MTVSLMWLVPAKERGGVPLQERHSPHAASKYVEKLDLASKSEDKSSIHCGLAELHRPALDDDWIICPLPMLPE